MSNIKLNILGNKYDFIQTTSKEDHELIESDGYCDCYEKVIKIDNDLEVNEFKNKVIRHEIIHAYLAESGLKKYFEDEIIVDWIAFQFPKLLKTFEETSSI